MKPAPCIRSPTVLWILLFSGFGTLSSAPHFVPLLPNTVIEGRIQLICYHWQYEEAFGNLNLRVLIIDSRLES
jgi:hypothetical protein